MRFLKTHFGDGRAASPPPADLQGLGLSDPRLEVALWGAGLGLWETDLRTDVTHWYDDWCERIDLDPCAGSDHVARWDAYVHPEDRAALTARLGAHLIGAEQIFQAEYRIRDRKGNWLWLFERGKVIERAPDGKPLRMIGVCREIGARKQAEEALRLSEFRYRSVVSMTPGYIFESRYAPEGVQLYWVSDGVEAIYGVTREEFIRLGGHDPFIDPEWVSVVRDRRAAIGRGESLGGEIKIRTATGQSKWLQVSAVPVRDPRTGSVIGALGSCYDITERKLAEIAFHESRSTLMTVADSSADVLALFDQQRKCVFLNRAIPGLTPEPWLGAPVEEFAPPEDRARVHDIFERVIHAGAAEDFEQVFTDSAHKLRCLEMRVRAVPSGDRMLGAVVNITEVTEQRAQRDTLRTQARIIETMREGVVLVDAGTMIVRLTNPTFERLFGYRSGELIGLSVEPLIAVPGHQRRKFERLFREPGHAGLPPVEIECVRRDGSRFVASCVISPLSMGGSEHWLAVVNDITEKKRLERGIIDIANREQQRIGSDLHDGLGQELTGIALMLRGVAAQLNKEGSDARLDVEDIIGLVNNAIENTRTLARGLSPVSAERGGLMAALRALAARATDRYGVHVDFKDLTSRVLPMHDDYATHLYRIAQEALTNVVRHSYASAATITLEDIGEELQLRIDDNGRGFDQKPPDSAVGLGLKMMRYRAQMLGGDLVLEASAEGGAAVRCTCPLEP